MASRRSGAAVINTSRPWPGSSRVLSRALAAASAIASACSTTTMARLASNGGRAKKRLSSRICSRRIWGRVFLLSPRSLASVAVMRSPFSRDVGSTQIKSGWLPCSRRRRSRDRPGHHQRKGPPENGGPLTNAPHHRPGKEIRRSQALLIQRSSKQLKGLLLPFDSGKQRLTHEANSKPSRTSCCTC